MKPRLLDLFCGAGGAAMGYHRAGFEVTGVDVKPQPRYPFAFVQADAMTYPLDGFDAIHASPPCQHATRLRALQKGKTYPALIAPTRERLLASGVPWAIENVEGAELHNPITLCGSAFGLGVRRHRLFEFSDRPTFWPQCEHDVQPKPVDVTGVGGPFYGKRKKGGGGVSRKPNNLAHARAVMGIDWMSRTELSQSIPPAYTQWVGAHLLSLLTISPAELALLNLQVWALTTPKYERGAKPPKVTV